MADEFVWEPFIGRCLARLCLSGAGMDERPVLERAQFLMDMGLPRAEAARVVGSSDDSLRVMFATKAKKTSKAKR
ncbi:MAG TPA: hypothetical protein VNB24_09160 [Acidimicrobiales bacterium]|nr:hypothetical protein [Acidimicrobiales bacterium]